MLYENINNDISLKNITISNLLKQADELKIELKSKGEIQHWLEMKDSISMK